MAESMVTKDILCYRILTTDFIVTDSENYTTLITLDKFRPPSLEKARLQMRSIAEFYPEAAKDIGLESDPRLLHPLDFKITLEDILRIFNDVKRILRNPKECLGYLQSLDAELAEELKRHRIDFSLDNDPKYLITTMGSWMPGPWPDGYRPMRKSHLLDAILLRREQKVGMNMRGIATFTELVSPEDAYAFMRQGNLFKEDGQFQGQIRHGKSTHRLVFEILRQAERCGNLNLRLASGLQLTQIQLLQLMISVQFQNFVDPLGHSRQKLMWDALQDFPGEVFAGVASVYREANRQQRYDAGEMTKNAMLDPDNYVDGCVSPVGTTSLILCHGKETIPHLRAYSLDSHYKHIAQMVHRLRILKVKNGIIGLNDDDLYSFCTITTSTDRYGGLVSNTHLAFQVDVEKRLKRYEEFGSKKPLLFVTPTERMLGKRRDVVGIARKKDIPPADIPPAAHHDADDAALASASAAKPDTTPGKRYDSMLEYMVLKRKKEEKYV